jgi:microcystin-dependent protein
MVLATVDGLTHEIVKVTAMTSNTFTIQRGMEGTVAAAFPAGSRVYNAPTMQTLVDRLNDFDTYMGNAIAAAQAQVATMANAFPIGEIIFVPYAFTSALLPNFLLDDGSAYSRTTYANLFARIGVMYGAGDGSTTFNVPDHRGAFLRIQDHGAGVDPNASTRAARADGIAGDNVGTLQLDCIKLHVHPTGANTGKATGGASVVDPGTWNSPGNSGGNTYTLDVGTSTVGDTINPTAYALVPMGLETRPRNINVVAVIRYQ